MQKLFFPAVGDGSPSPAAANTPPSEHGSGKKFIHQNGLDALETPTGTEGLPEDTGNMPPIWD